MAFGTVKNPTTLSAIPTDLLNVNDPADTGRFGADLPGQNQLDSAFGATESMLAGDIPQDVQDQLAQISAERGIQSGLGSGEAARNLTMRDLGRTSLDLQQQGIQNVQGLGQVQTQYTQLQESMKEWDDQYAIMMRDDERSSTQLSLMGYEMISQNERFSMELANNLIATNASHAIDNVQDYIDVIMGSGDELPAYMGPANQATLDLIRELQNSTR